jgi:hypothetical protein
MEGEAGAELEAAGRQVAAAAAEQERILQVFGLVLAKALEYLWCVDGAVMGLGGGWGILR